MSIKQVGNRHTRCEVEVVSYRVLLIDVVCCCLKRVIDSTKIQDIADPRVLPDSQHFLSDMQCFI